MAIVSLDGNTKYTTMIFKVIPEFISNDIKNNKVKDNYQEGNIIYDIKNINKLGNSNIFVGQEIIIPTL